MFGKNAWKSSSPTCSSVNLLTTESCTPLPAKSTLEVQPEPPKLQLLLFLAASCAVVYLYQDNFGSVLFPFQAVSISIEAHEAGLCISSLSYPEFLYIYCFLAYLWMWTPSSKLFLLGHHVCLLEAL